MHTKTNICTTQELSMKSLYPNPSPRATKQPMTSSVKKNPLHAAMYVTIFCRSSEMFTSVAPAWGCRWPLFKKHLYFCHIFLQKFTFTFPTAFFLTESFLQCPHRLQHRSRMAANRLQPILALQGQVNGLCNYVSRSWAMPLVYRHRKRPTILSACRCGF